MLAPTVSHWKPINGILSVTKFSKVCFAAIVSLTISKPFSLFRLVQPKPVTQFITSRNYIPNIDSIQRTFKICCEAFGLRFRNQCRLHSSHPQLHHRHVELLRIAYWLSIIRNGQNYRRGSHGFSPSSDRVIELLSMGGCHDFGPEES